MIRWNKVKAFAAAAMLSAAIGMGAPGIAALAATGTVIGDRVNVRSDASTSSNIVGTAVNGETYDLGETKDDDTGATWYQITLSSGDTGYIRSDFLNVTEDSSTSGSTEDDAAGEGSTQDAGTDSSSTDTGDYQIIMAPDENGTQTYYLYNNAAKERMKLSDIETMKTQLQEAQSAAQSIQTQYRVILIILGVIAVILLAVCIMLVVRLRDALSGRRSHERDLTQERRNQRRNGEANVDGLGGLKRTPRGQNPAARRSDAYPSGTRRAVDATIPGPARDPRMAQRRPAGRPVAANPNSRESGVPGAAGQQNARTARPQNPQAAGENRRYNPAGRPAGTGAPAGGAVRRPVRNEEPVQGRASAAGEAQANRRPAGNPQPQNQRPSEGAAAGQEAARKAQPQPKNFADDDDLDYDFISLDDKDES